MIDNIEDLPHKEQVALKIKFKTMEEIIAELTLDEEPTAEVS